MEQPCSFEAAEVDPEDPTAITPVVNNNQCARQVRERYVELQTWIRGRVQ